MLTIAAIVLLTFLSLLICRKIISKQTVSLATAEIAAALCFKVGLGIVYGYVFLHYYNGDDTWQLNNGSIDEYNKLVKDPLAFFTDLISFELYKDEPFTTRFHHYLADLEFCIICKPLAVFNFISRGNYYINVVFFNSIVFWGHYWLFSLLVKEFPNKRRALLAIIFFFPPVVFWLSGIRADGLLFFFISLLLLQYSRWLYRHKKRNLVLSIVALAFIFILRNAFVLLLVPLLLAWFITVRYQKKPVIVFALTYAACLLVFFASALVSPKASLPAMIVSRQQEYLGLQGNTRFGLDSLQATAGSFIRVLPQAANNTFLRPYIWEAKGPLQVFTALDQLFFWLLVVLAIVQKEKYRHTTGSSTILQFFVYFSLSLYILVGYTVPFPGAIVRYKIIAELFLLTAIILNINWPHERKIIKKVHI